MRINTHLKSFFKNPDLITTLTTLVFILGCIFTINAQCPTPPGNPAIYGNNQWIGYVYSGLDANNPPQNTGSTVVYRGFVNQTEIFNQDLVDAAISGPNVCGSYADLFFIRFRMRKNFQPGYYSFTIGGDDGERLSFDGGATWAMSDWNYHSYQAITQTFYLDGTKDMVLENYDQGGQSRIAFSYTFCGMYSTAPTSIGGNTNTCSGSYTTLTATGGNFVAGTTYQWGTGATVGTSPLAGQTSESLTVNPLATTTYWVRRVNPAACGGNTTGVTQQVTVTPISSAPTMITGNSSVCLGTGTTLTATGGTLAAGAIYEWGTGSVGSNIISGQSTASISVTPTTNTTYWVRRVDASPCAGVTAAAIVNVQVNTPAGDQVSYGNDSWIGYVYATIGTANPPVDTFTVPYRGYLTLPTTFDQNWGTAALSGANICGTYPARFAIRFKMTKNFPAGYYTFTVGGDDGYRLSLDGGSNFVVSGWTDHGYATTTYTQYLSGSTNLVLEYYEQTGSAQVSFTYTGCTSYSSAPTGISGTTTICNGAGTTLTANGGTMGANATYQWGTGTVGTNIIAGQTGASVTVYPTVSTTYWVRRLDAAPCNMTSAAVSQLITVNTVSTNPTSITTPATTICSGRTIILTATGGTTGTGGFYQWGTGYTAGSNIIAGETGQTMVVTPGTTTAYWVRRVDPSPCNTTTGGQNITITVIAGSTAPTTITGITSICNGGNTNLTASGGIMGGNAVYQWGIGNTVGNNIIAGETNATIYVSPIVSTSYWVRRVDNTPCSANTGGIVQLITVGQRSTDPTSVSGNASICLGTQITLTAVGGSLAAGGAYQWGTGAVGSNIIAGQTTVSYVVTPSVSTTYWVRRIDPAPCSTVTNAISFPVNVAIASVPQTSITGNTLLCAAGGGTTLTAVGGILGTNAVYQWGTGNVGSNIFGGNQSTQYVNPTVTTTYWVRIVDSAPCAGYTNASTVVVTVNTRSANPVTISGANSICNGSNTILTASGGTIGTGSYYEWGTGTTIGQNIIAGQNANTLTVAPTSQTVYWVRRVDPAPCNLTTGGPTITINVTNPSTAPTSISGAGNAACYGTPRTLVADGGTGSVYQWGTGTVGTNIINGQTGNSITVNPTSTTNYWVRRYDGTPCSAYTAAATTTVQITVPAGNPATFGDGNWIVYGYNNPDLTLTSAIYAGSYVQTSLGFDSSTSWPTLSSPSSASNWIGCTVANDNFTFVQKRRNFPCGTYTVTMQNWDDAVEVYIDGVLRWSCASYSGGNPCNGFVGNYVLNATSTIEVRVRENGGNANAALQLINTTVNPTAPTTIDVSDAAPLCFGSAITLSASGGLLGSGSTYQWGTGIIGENIIADQSTATLTVNPTENTTYWVRRVNSLCGNPTAAISNTVTVNPATLCGNLSSPSTTVCQGTAPSLISLLGNNGNIVKWQYSSDANFASDVTDINATTSTLSSTQIGAISATKYFRVAVQYGSCPIRYSDPLQIAISAPAVFSNGVWNSIPTNTTPVEINGNLSITSDLHVCSCQVNAGATVTIAENTNLIVENNLTVDPSATFIIEDKGSLVQINDTSTDIGNALVKRKSAPMKLYDYSYWSAPVQGWRLNQLSPATLSDKYFYFNTAINNWSVITAGNQIMDAGRGYIVRAPQGWSNTNATSGVYAGTFSGIPNNGAVLAPIQKGPGTLNLIGNPYPSAIDIDTFLTDPANANVVTGTVYLWTHNTAISSATPGAGLYNYTSDDYAKYNLTGGVRTASSAIAGGIRPDGKIASGQSFFIEAHGSLTAGTYSATFKNSMRVAGNNGQFYRTSGSSTAKTEAISALEKNRIWVSITNSQGAYNEVLLGYVTGATNDFDNLYDGRTMSTGNVLSMYSIVGAENLSIQGRALPFNAADILPLGFKTSISGTFTIALDSFDGLFTTQNVYIVDKLNNTSQNLKNGSFNFTSAIGTFNTRFEIRFVAGTARELSPEIATKIDVASKEKRVSISASENMKHIDVFDLLGRLLYTSDDINTFDFTTSALITSEQVLIVKIKLMNGTEETRKVLMD